MHSLMGGTHTLPRHHYRSESDVCFFGRVSRRNAGSDLGKTPIQRRMKCPTFGPNCLLFLFPTNQNPAHIGATRHDSLKLTAIENTPMHKRIEAVFSFAGAVDGIGWATAQPLACGGCDSAPLDLRVEDNLYRATQLNPSALWTIDPAPTSLNRLSISPWDPRSSFSRGQAIAPV